MSKTNKNKFKILPQNREKLSLLFTIPLYTFKKSRKSNNNNNNNKMLIIICMTRLKSMKFYVDNINIFMIFEINVMIFIIIKEIL